MQLCLAPMMAAPCKTACKHTCTCTLYPLYRVMQTWHAPHSFPQLLLGSMHIDRRLACCQVNKQPAQQRPGRCHCVHSRQHHHPQSGLSLQRDGPEEEYGHQRAHTELLLVLFWVAVQHCWAGPACGAWAPICFRAVQRSLKGVLAVYELLPMCHLKKGKLCIMQDLYAT